jgi:hypothetical protein
MRFVAGHLLSILRGIQKQFHSTLFKNSFLAFQKIPLSRAAQSLVNHRVLQLLYVCFLLLAFSVCSLTLSQL